MTSHCAMTVEQDDFQQSPHFEDLPVGKQIIIWAIRVVMDDLIPSAGRDALVEEAFMRAGAHKAAETFLEFMDAFQEKSGRPFAIGAKFVSRGELDLLNAVGPLLHRNGFSFE